MPHNAPRFPGLVLILPRPKSSPEADQAQGGRRFDSTCRIRARSYAEGIQIAKTMKPFLLLILLAAVTVAGCKPQQKTIVEALQNVTQPRQCVSLALAFRSIQQIPARKGRPVVRCSICPMIVHPRFLWRMQRQKSLTLHVGLATI